MGKIVTKNRAKINNVLKYFVFTKNFSPCYLYLR
jgi:hypothetical protein